MILRSASVVIALTLIISESLSVRAADLKGVLTDYTITAWNARDGLPPGNVWALTQDAAGYLWVGSDGGLLRFDGVRFVHWEAEDPLFAQKAVRSLHHSPDGTLWVGFGDAGGISRLRDGRIHSYGEKDGLPSGAVMALAEGPDGTLWAGGDAGLFSLHGAHWRKWTADRGLPDLAVYSIFIDSRRHFYVGTETGVFRRLAGAENFEQIETAEGAPLAIEDGNLGARRSLTEAASGRVLATVGRFPRSFVEDGSGRVLVNDSNVGFHAIGGPLSADSRERGRGQRLLIDRRQNLWIGTIGQGLWRVRSQPDARVMLVERSTSLTGLLSDGIGALLEDREGNIWAGTTEGLNRLTPRRITQLTSHGLVVAIDKTPDGNVWAGTVDELIRFPPGSETPSARLSLNNSRLRTMHADERGTVWVATNRYLARVPAGTSALMQVRNVPVPVDLISSDANRGVWLYTQTQGFWHFTGEQAARFALPAELHGAKVSILYTDRGGRLWAALMDGRVARLTRDGAIDVYGAAQGLNAGVVRQVFEDREGVVWLAATAGLAQFKGGHFVTIRSDAGFPVNDLTAIAEDDADNLWIGSGFGIVRIGRKDFDAVATGAAPAFKHNLFTRSDGLAGLPHAYDNNRRVVRASDGRLWYVTSRGLSLIDPRAFLTSRVPAPITIEHASADGRRLEQSPDIRLPAGTSRVEIVYSQLNLGEPFKTRFRYRLDGFDPQWVEAGSRRQAFYTNLPPRSYRFEVAASTDDGGWLEPAVWTFAIEPRFYQTSWFYVMVAVALGLTVWALWRLRLRQMQRQFALVLKERVRLSRELHDTLLQSLVGVALQFDAVAADVEASSARTQKQFVRMRKQVEEYIREARQSIWDLRSPTLQRRNLLDALRDLGEHATTAGSSGAAFEFKVTGQAQPCSHKVEEQLLRIGGEAVTNAVRHARATRIEMTVSYDHKLVTLEVADDGCGFDLSRLPVVEEEHYGLITMRERAEELKGALVIASKANQGTRIRAVVPLASTV